MKVEKLTLNNFRNISHATFCPDSRLNFLVGANGQGKTSFVEALGLLATLRSFRESKSASLVKWGTTSGEVSCELTFKDAASGEWRTNLKVNFQMPAPDQPKCSKMAYINEKPFRSSAHYLSQRFGSYELGFHAIVFNPSDHELVRGEPSNRRAYLDRVLIAEDIEYLHLYQKYHKVLNHRNVLLKSDRPVDREVMLQFTEQLCRYGANITFKRLKWIERLSLVLTDTLKQIAPEQSDLRFAYLSPWVSEIENLSYKNNNLSYVHFTGHLRLPSLELLEQLFLARVEALREAEQKAGCSLVGPHRDDWAFFIGGHVLKGHGSQGEIRSALLALKLCELELFRKETGHRPLFLLDDFSSELDKRRRHYLLNFLTETDLQTFVTTTEDTNFVGKRYWVSNGVIEEGTHDDRPRTIQFG